MLVFILSLFFCHAYALADELPQDLNERVKQVLESPEMQKAAEQFKAKWAQENQNKNPKQKEQYLNALKKCTPYEDKNFLGKTTVKGKVKDRCAVEMSYGDSGVRVRCLYSAATIAALTDEKAYREIQSNEVKLDLAHPAISAMERECEQIKPQDY